ncbi:hypothetical protein JTB14_027270 [Gonioctena quinquepunctata]|nr:hypothetical protein JTB14_027270 [Gonioctena quinquepunctata]
MVRFKLPPSELKDAPRGLSQKKLKLKVKISSLHLPNILVIYIEADEINKISEKIPDTFRKTDLKLEKLKKDLDTQKITDMNDKNISKIKYTRKMVKSATLVDNGFNWDSNKPYVIFKEGEDMYVSPLAKHKKEQTRQKYYQNGNLRTKN